MRSAQQPSVTPDIGRKSIVRVSLRPPATARSKVNVAVPQRHQLV